MSICVIWVDRENAKLFKFSDEETEKKNLHASYNDHHTHTMDNDDLQKIERQFFSKIVASIDREDLHQVLILGPGVAKHQFRTYLFEHDPFLARKIVACETVDHPTDPQIAAWVRKFFKSPLHAET